MIEWIIHKSIYPTDASTMAEHMRQTTRADGALPCRLHWVRIHVTERSATLCTFFILLLCLTSVHLFTIAKHYFALKLQYGVARCLFQWFFAETWFWSFWPNSLQLSLLWNFIFQLYVPFAGSHHKYLKLIIFFLNFRNIFLEVI